MLSKGFSLESFGITRRSLSDLPLDYTSVSQSIGTAERQVTDREREALHSKMNTFFSVSIKPLAAVGPTHRRSSVCVFSSGGVCTHSCVFTHLCQSEKTLRFWWLNLRLGLTPLDILFTPCELLPNVP